MAALYYISTEECDACKSGQKIMENGGPLADEIIQSVIKLAKDMDPYILKDCNVGFRNKIMSVTVSGKVGFNGQLTGLESLQQIKHYYIPTKDCRLIFGMECRAEDLNLSHTIRVKLMNLDWIFAINAVLPVVPFALHFEVNPFAEMEAHLSRFYLRRIVESKVWVSGFGLLNGVLQAAIKELADYFTKTTNLSQYLDDYLKQKLANVKFPIKEDHPEISRARGIL